MRRRWFLAVVALLAIFAAIEVSLRLVGLGNPPIAMRDDELEYRLIPDKKYNRWGNRILINSHGFRANDHSKEISGAEVRLLLLGDSVVYGNHFLDQDETIALRLSAMLSSPSCHVRVIPMAVSSWGPINQAAALSRHGTFKATEVAIVLSAHDLVDTPTAPDGSLVPYRLSPPIGAIGDLVEAIVERRFPPEPTTAAVPYETRARASLAALDAIKDRIETEGAGLLFVYNATTPERISGTLDEGLRLFDWAERHDLETLDLGAVPDVTYRDTIHPDAGGAARIARTLSEINSDRLVCRDRR